MFIQCVVFDFSRGLLVNYSAETCKDICIFSILIIHDRWGSIEAVEYRIINKHTKFRVLIKL